ncbi:MAG: cyaB [Bacteroidetes bacterium]|nr:cyaB [Bacteroidota bacterium]
MATNLELKSGTESLTSAHQAARSMGLSPAETLDQTDVYFAVSRGRLKLRLIEGKGAELIYYEREDERTARWSTYTRLAVADPNVLQGMLAQALGVRGVVKKHRTVYLHDSARIHLDRVEGLGDFLEFEIVETGEKKASALMERLKAVFSVSQSAMIGGSYIDLLEARGKVVVDRT